MNSFNAAFFVTWMLFNYIDTLLQCCEQPTLILAKNLRCSRTVSLSKRTLCWGQMPRLCLIWSMLLRMSYPLMTAVPPVGVYRPGNRRGEVEKREGGGGGGGVLQAHWIGEI